MRTIKNGACSKKWALPQPSPSTISEWPLFLIRNPFYYGRPLQLCTHVWGPLCQILYTISVHGTIIENALHDYAAAKILVFLFDLHLAFYATFN